MKKSLHPLITLFLLYLIIFYVHSVWASIISIDNQSARPGENVTFTVTIGPSSNDIDSFGFDIYFDNNMLQYTGFSAATITQGLDLFDVSKPANNFIRVGGFGVNPLKIRKAEGLVYLHFTCKECNKAQSSLTISKMVDNVSKWQSQPGQFTCLGNEDKTENNPETYNKTDAKDMTGSYTLSSMKNGSFTDRKKPISNPSVHADSYNKKAMNINNMDMKQSLQREALHDKGNAINGINDKTSAEVLKNSGLIVVYKGPSIEQPDDPKQEEFDMSGLSAGHRIITSVKAVHPGNGDAGISTDTPIKITFSQSMDHLTAENAFSITPHIEGHFEWKNLFTQMEFTPYSPLIPGTTYTVYLTGEARDVYGQPIDQETCFTFQTEEKPEEIKSDPAPVYDSPKVMRCFITTALYKYNRNNDYYNDDADSHNLKLPVFRLLNNILILKRDFFQLINHGK